MYVPGDLIVHRWACLGTVLRRSMIVRAWPAF